MGSADVLADGYLAAAAELLPQDIRRHAAQNDPDIDCEAGRLAHEIIPEQEERGHEKHERHDRIAPRQVGTLESRLGAPQHEHPRDRQRVERPDADDELVGERREGTHQFIIGIWPFYALAVAGVFVLRNYLV